MACLPWKSLKLQENKLDHKRYTENKVMRWAARRLFEDSLPHGETY